MEVNYKYKKLSDFRKAHPSKYVWLSNKKLLEQLCLDMDWALPKEQIKKPKGYWNVKENCIEEAKKYNSYTDMVKKQKQMSKIIRKNGWLNEITQLMGWELRKPKSYWEIKENCIEECKKYKNYNELIKQKAMLKSIIKNNWKFEIIQLMGWELNRNLPGYFEIKENCIEDAKKYKTKLEYNKKSKSYRSSVKNGWINEICDLMGWRKSVKQIQKPSNYWTKERCIEEAKKYKNYSDFRKSGGAYSTSVRDGYLPEIKELMNWSARQTKPSGYWEIKENCIEEAKKYKKYSDFIKNGSAYYVANKNGWLNEIKELMNWPIRQAKPPNYWTKERCIEEASKYNNATEFNKKSRSAYFAAQRNGWLNEIKELNNW